MAEPLTIGRLARRSGITVETVRFYERRGLLRRPPRPGRAFRVSPEQAVGRLLFIRQAQGLGFTLREIAELLRLQVTPGADCAAVRTRAAAKLADADRRLVALRRIRAALATLVAACPGSGAVTQCTILDALAQPGDSRRAAPGPARGGTRSKAMKSLELKIDGMHCDGCASTIEALLAREPGVKGASVSYAGGKGQILYAPAATDPSRIAATIERAGYRVTGAADAAT